MKLPKKISPDRIKESIVEFKYAAEIPYPVIVGFIFKALDDTYTFTNRPLQKKTINSEEITGNPQEITLNIDGNNIFFTDEIKIELRPNSLIFNCLDKYIGWQSYIEAIKRAISQILIIEEIKEFNRIGIRYISEYPENDLKNISKFEFTFGITDIESETYSFKSEFSKFGLNIILNLHHKSPVVKSVKDGEVSITPTSYIDIDVIKPMSTRNLEELIQYLNFSHDRQKEIFFNLLKPSFLETLNPEY